jgi:hypothetical protein
MSGYVPNSRLSSMMVCRPCCHTVVLAILRVSGAGMNDGKNFWLALLACLAVLMILMIITYAGTADALSTKTAAQPPIPKAGPLAQPRSPQQVGLPVDQTQAVNAREGKFEVCRCNGGSQNQGN